MTGWTEEIKRATYRGREVWTFRVEHPLHGEIRGVKLTQVGACKAAERARETLSGSAHPLTRTDRTV